MGQYFKAVNLDKEEVVCPWCLSGGAKLWEWAANRHGAVFTLLLRKSDGSGGGDYFGYRTQNIELDASSTDPAQTFLNAIQTAVAAEGKRVEVADDSVVGRWAGDRVVLVGDYDSSELWEKSKNFRNISAELADAWNGFIDIADMKLEYRADCSCRDN